MTISVRNLSLAALLPLGLAGCGDSGDSSQSAALMAQSFENRISTSFATYFDASPTTPDASVRHPTSADVPPLSLTTEPLDN